jgi:acetolactate synthase regulatory subunit
VVFRFLALVEVICSAEKSKTSSDSNRRIDMLFSQIDKLVWQDDMISLMKVGQL